MSFVTRHWRGELPLWLAFWVNGVCVWLVRDAIDAEISPIRWLTSDPMNHLVIAPLYAFVYLTVTLWSLHGIGRSIVVSRTIRTPGLAHHLARLLTLYQRLSMWLFLFVAVLVIWNGVQPIKMGDREYVYSLDRPWYGAVRVEGAITFGLPGDLRAALRADPDLHTLVVNSPGGFYDEALLIRELVQEYGLNVEVENQCNSACTHILAAANKAILQHEANVGFHRISLGDQATSFLNSIAFAKWLVEDTNLLRDDGVPRDFIRRVHATPFRDLWVPSVAQLAEAGFIDEISYGGVTYTISDYCAIERCDQGWYLQNGEWRRVS